MKLRQNPINSDSKVFSAFSFRFNCIRPIMIKPFFLKRGSLITLSDMSFNEKIIRKYWQNKINCLPTMIFSNKKQSALSQITNMNFLIQFHFLNKIKTIVPQFMKVLIFPKSVALTKSSAILIIRKIFKINELSSSKIIMLWLDSIALGSGKAYSTSSGGTVNRHSLTYGGNLLIQNLKTAPIKSIVKQVKTELYAQNKSLLNIFNDAIYMQASCNFSSSFWMLSRPLMDIRPIHVTTGQYPSTQNIEKHRSMTFIKSVFKSANGTLIESTDNNNSVTFIKPTIKQDISKYASNTSKLTSLEENYIFKDSENFYFQDNRKIEQALDQIKRIAVEVEETLTKKSMSGDTQRQVDVSQISDKVYQMIDYRLKIEKERRSYL